MLGGHVLGVGHEAHGGQVEVRRDDLAALEDDVGLGGVRRRGAGGFDAGAVLDGDVELLELVGGGRGRDVAVDELVAGADEDDLLGLAVLVAELAGELDARGARAGDDDVGGGLDLVRGGVEEGDGLLVAAVGLPGDVVAGGAGARGEDELVVGDGALAGGGGDADRLGVKVGGLGGADDQLVALGGVLLQGIGDGLEEVLVCVLAGDDGADGAQVPVEVRVLGGRGSAREFHVT